MLSGLFGIFLKVCHNFRATNMGYRRVAYPIISLGRQIFSGQQSYNCKEVFFFFFFKLSRWDLGKEFSCQSRRCRFDTWVRKIPWWKKWKPTPIFLPGKSHQQRSLLGYSQWCHRVEHNWETHIFTFRGTHYEADNILDLLKGDGRGWDDWMASPTQWTWVSKLREMVMDREAWRAAVHRVTKSDMTEQMNWTELLGGKTWWWWQGHKKRSNSEYVVLEVRSSRMSW